MATFQARPSSGCSASSAQYPPAAIATSGPIASSAVSAPCCSVPALKRRSRKRAYRPNSCCTPLRQWNARHCSSPSAIRIAMRFMACGSFQEFFADRLEQRGVRLSKPFEYHHLARHDAHALLPHARKRQVAVDRVPRAYAIGNDVDLLAFVVQVERGLQDAHVTLDADDNDLRAIASGQVREALRADTGKPCLGRYGARRQERADLGHQRSEPLGILLDRCDRYADLLRDADQPRAIAQDLVVFGDGRKHFLLKIDREQQRPLRVEQHLMLLVIATADRFIPGSVRRVSRAEKRLCAKRAQPFRQRRRALRIHVDPYDACAALGVLAIVHPQFVMGVQARSPGASTDIRTSMTPG